MVIRKYGSMINTLNPASTFTSSTRHGDLQFDVRDKSAGEDGLYNRDSMHIGLDDEALEPQQTVQETTAYQGQKFDLIGFSDYFPFGLKQVNWAVTSINQMLSRADEEVKVAKPASPTRSFRAGGSAGRTLEPNGALRG